jgi:hypothetical protein
MRMPFRSVLVAGAVAALAFPATAAARAGDATFAQTFPRANALCVTVAAGSPAPAPYTGNEDGVLEACVGLQAAFANADAAMDAANAAFDAGVSAAAATRDAACQRPRRPITCVLARLQFQATVAGLRTTRRAAVLAYGAALRDARGSFWQAAGEPAGPQPT